MQKIMILIKYKLVGLILNCLEDLVIIFGIQTLYLHTVISLSPKKCHSNTPKQFYNTYLSGFSIFLKLKVINHLRISFIIYQKILN